MQIIKKDETRILNYCAKYIARDNQTPLHNFGQFKLDDHRSRICESWRFPIIENHYDDTDTENPTRYNEVTFVYSHIGTPLPNNASVLGSFNKFYTAIPMYLIPDTSYYVVTILVPKYQIHRYKFYIDGNFILDPINPQFFTQDNKKEWSFFFTDYCTIPIILEKWEIKLLERLVNHILPFRTKEGQNFLDRYYYSLDRRTKESDFPTAYLIDDSIGVTNFIDKVLAREERHHIVDYKICLEIIYGILYQRKPNSEPWTLSKEFYIDLFYEMAQNNVNGWNYNKYNNPAYFLQLLRRHVFTGAFSHPKYGGNAAGTGWAYLDEKYIDNTANTLFNWRKSIEKPLGTNTEYRG